MSENLANEILKILEASKDSFPDSPYIPRVFTPEELARELKGKYSLEEIRDAMWLLDQQGKAKLWVRLP